MESYQYIYKTPRKMDKVIQQVDQKLEGDLGSTKKAVGISAIYGQLSSTNRDVNKLLSRMRHNAQSLPKQGKQPNANPTTKQVQKQKDNVIGKYNYYGKKYRFQLKEQELTIQAPKIQRQCVSQINFSKQFKPIHQSSPKTERNKIITNNATVDQSVFFDDGQIKMPSQQYYIYFDQPEAKKIQKNIHYKNEKLNKLNKMNKTSNQFNIEQHLPQKFKPAWLMQKKINSLQKQVNDMKLREKRRLNEEFNTSKAMRNTVDGPIRLKSNIQRMVETLWR